MDIKHGYKKDTTKYSEQSPELNQEEPGPQDPAGPPKQAPFSPPICSLVEHTTKRAKNQ
jgi:hypothetical protein